MAKKEKNELSPAEIAIAAAKGKSKFDLSKYEKKSLNRARLVMKQGNTYTLRIDAELIERNGKGKKGPMTICQATEVFSGTACEFVAGKAIKDALTSLKYVGEIFEFNVGKQVPIGGGRKFRPVVVNHLAKKK